mmetsp:Transcript_4153/g.6347  ORF Transcript_4153/g.6347 Transcript_4153/m.6347 type:complete len:109 (+) Transcript_4153:859-1185(+)
MSDSDSFTTSKSIPIKSTAYDNKRAVPDNVAPTFKAGKRLEEPEVRVNNKRLGRLVAGADSKKANASPDEPPAFCIPAASAAVVCSQSCNGSADARTPIRSKNFPIRW